MGSWNKWRGPALRGEVAFYAAKARRDSIDREHRRGTLKGFNNAALLALSIFIPIHKLDRSTKRSSSATEKCREPTVRQPPADYRDYKRPASANEKIGSPMIR